MFVNIITHVFLLPKNQMFVILSKYPMIELY